MVLDDGLLRQARDAADRLIEAQRQTDLAKADYHHAIRRLHFTGGSLREIAEALDISHQRVHQIIESSGGTTGWRPRKKSSTDLACTFCGLPAAEVRKLVAGPGVYICDGCVALARQVTAADRPADTPRTHLDPVPAGSQLQCSFCGKGIGTEPDKKTATAMVAGPGVRVCDGCLQLCEEVIAASV